MALTTKRISKVIIKGLRSPEQDTKQFLVKAESQSSNYTVSVLSEVKLSSNQLEYIQAEPIVIPIIYGEIFLYKVSVISNDGRVSAETIISDVKDNKPTAPSGITIVADSTVLKATATYSPAITDILRHEWIVSDSVLSSAPTIDTLPTHISEGTSSLLYPGKFTKAHTTRFWVRRIDSNNNISDWYLQDTTGTTDITITKIDVDTEILDTNNRILTATEKTNLAADKTLAGNVLYHTGNKPNKTDVGLGSVDNKQQIPADSGLTNLIRNGAFNTGTVDPFISTSNQTTLPDIDFTTSSNNGQTYVGTTFTTGSQNAWLAQNIFISSIVNGDKISCSFEVKAQPSTAPVDIDFTIWQISSPITTVSTISGLNANSAGYIGTGHINAVDITGNFVKHDFTVITNSELTNILIRIYLEADPSLTLTNVIVFRNISLYLSEVSPKFSEHPEDAIERRNIGEAAKIINDLFIITSGGVVTLKQDIYAKDGTTKMLNAADATANTSPQAQSGTGTSSSGYTKYTS